MFYIVFAARSIQSQDPYHGAPQGVPELVWSNPVGVFKADTATQACQAAAKKVGAFGNFFAVEGTPWGLDIYTDDGVQEFGKDEIDFTLTDKTRELERSVGMREDGSWNDEVIDADSPTRNAA